MKEKESSGTYNFLYLRYRIQFIENIPYRVTENYQIYGESMGAERSKIPQLPY